MLDYDEEVKNDEGYDPEAWLNTYSDKNEIKKGIELIGRLRSEKSKDFYSIIIQNLLYPDIGILEHLETEIDDDVDKVRKLYKGWKVPFCVISQGGFFTYIDAEDPYSLSMESYSIQRMQVRNCDEGDI